MFNCSWAEHVVATLIFQVLKNKMSKMEKKSVLDILTEIQLEHIVSRMSKPGSQIVSHDLKPACEEGLAGFLGEHYKVMLCVKECNSVREINLFVKTVPAGNKPKADFIEQNQFFKKEALVFQLLDEIQDVYYLKPWCIKAIIHDEKVIVMPDLSIHGYKTHPKEICFDQNHVFIAVSSLARFHAAFANYFTKIKPAFLEDHGFINEEPFSDGEAAWLKGAAKVTYNMLKEFSSKEKNYPVDLEDILTQLYIQAYASVKSKEDTLNVVVHKDLWAHNILFQYNNDVPINAVLVDFQLARYAPPTFDVMSLLYLTASREFRECYESEILRYYYAVFSENLDDATKRRLLSFNYDFEGFLTCCEKARMFGLVQANGTIPCVCMDPEVEKTTFDDPDTYMEHVTGDRSKPVVEHARDNAQYRLRILEVGEEFVEKYVLKL